jgi:hypothetical protein
LVPTVKKFSVYPKCVFYIPKTARLCGLGLRGWYYKPFRRWFKLQAVFFLPVLLVLALRRRLPVKYLFLIPVVFLLMLAPALIAGRDIWSLLSIYAVQIVTGGIEGQPAWIKHQPIPFSFLTRNAPS